MKFEHHPVTKSDLAICERLEAVHAELVKFNQAAEKEKASIIASVPTEEPIEETDEPNSLKKKKKK